MSDQPEQPANPAPTDPAPAEQLKAKQYCGIVMPISAIDDCSEVHWREVRQILYETVESTGLTPNLVSESESIGVILKDIITNLYTYPLIIADVSGKNSNVYFELGMRLTFDRAAIVIKDNVTDFSFDTSSIRHLTYPRDLNYWGIRQFKSELKAKIEGTLEASKAENFSMFLGHFGQFKVPELSTTTVSAFELLLAEIRQLKQATVKRNTFTLTGKPIDEADSYGGKMRSAARTWFKINPPVPETGESLAEFRTRHKFGFCDYLRSLGLLADPETAYDALRDLIKDEGNQSQQVWFTK